MIFLTTQERRYIILEKRFGRTYKDVGEELGIKPQAISNDHHRHKEKWEHDENYLELLLREGRDRVLDDFITQCREQLMDLASHIEEQKKMVEDSLKIPDFFARHAKKFLALEVELARQEVRLCIMLSKKLAERYELSLSDHF